MTRVTTLGGAVVEAMPQACSGSSCHFWKQLTLPTRAEGRSWATRGGDATEPRPACAPVAWGTDLGHLQPTGRHGLRGGWSLRGQEAGGSTPHRDEDPELQVSQRRVQACPPLARPEGSGSRRPRPRCPQPLPARSRALQPLTSRQTGRPESLGGRQGSSYEGARGIRCEPATTRTDKFAH